MSESDEKLRDLTERLQRAERLLTDVHERVERLENERNTLNRQLAEELARWDERERRRAVVEDLKQQAMRHKD